MIAQMPLPATPPLSFVSQRAAVPSRRPTSSWPAMHPAERARVGVVMGRFAPFHRGHRLLVETAAAGCEELYVLIIGRAADDAVAPLAVRESWLRELVAGPQIHVVAIHTELPDSNGDPAIIARWCDLVRDAVGRPIDRLYSSEASSYGDWTAAGLGAEHVLVDPARVRVPISATMIRADPLATSAYMDPPVRAWFVRRVRVIGADPDAIERLADELARRFATARTPQAGRPYALWAGPRGRWSAADCSTVARAERRTEARAARRAAGLLVCTGEPNTAFVEHDDALTIVVDAIGSGIWTSAADREHDAWQRRLVADLGAHGRVAIVVSGAPDEQLAAAVDAIRDATGVTPPDAGAIWLAAGRAGEWRALELSAHSWRVTRQIAGNGTVASEIAWRLANGIGDYTSVAAELGVDEDAVREADWYAAAHPELVAAEACRDRKALARLVVGA